MTAPTQTRAPDAGAICTVVAVVFTMVLLGLWCWRAALPNNRQRPAVDFVVFETDGVPYYLPRGTNAYDSIVTLATAHNFARDGFFRTHFLPNRKGVPQASFFDVLPYTQCESLSPPQHVQTYSNGIGERVQNTSLNNDCVYIHYPPLADWIYGTLATFGLETVLAFKFLALCASCATLLALYFWLRREVSAPAALVALVLAGTLPASARWADALFYHSFQFLFLACGILSWSSYLRAPRRLLFWLTWLLYFGEALCSFELTLCFGIVLLGMTIADRGLSELRPRLRGLLLQALAPVTAFALHVGMAASLLGFRRAYDNLSSTAAARATEGAAGVGMAAGLRQLALWVSDDILPWTMACVGLALVVAARAIARAPMRRPLALLGALFAGGVSFWVVFPGTTSAHNWMMYRHLMPCLVFLLALVAEALVLTLRSKNSPLAAAALAAACCAHLGWVAYRNVVQARHEIRWNRTRNQVVDRANLVGHHLDVLYWSEGSPPRAQGLQGMPVSGLRVNEPPSWVSDFRILGPTPSNYEVWWLDDQHIGRVRLLVDRPQADTAASHCTIGFFDGEGFRAMPAGSTGSISPFVPAAGEPPAPRPYAWVSYTMPSPLRARALRLTCAGMDSFALRQIEAFSR